MTGRLHPQSLGSKGKSDEFRHGSCRKGLRCRRRSGNLGKPIERDLFSEAQTTRRIFRTLLFLMILCLVIFEYEWLGTPARVCTAMLFLCRTRYALRHLALSSNRDEVVIGPMSMRIPEDRVCHVYATAGPCGVCVVWVSEMRSPLI